jgi:Tol biopolymer transport system component
VRVAPRLACVAVAALLSSAMRPATASVSGQSRSGATPGDQPLTIFDRHGRVVRSVGEPGLYSQPAFSPDGTRVAVTKIDSQTQQSDIWVFALSTGEGTRITSDPELHTDPVWSPDGRHLAFVARRGGMWSLSRTSSSGTVGEELLYRHAGFGGISNLAWSTDGRFLSFADLINISGALYVLPLDGDRQVREVLRPPLFNARISPTGQLIANSSSQSGKSEIYVRPFDLSSSALASSAQAARQVSRDGGVGTAFWRRDWNEIYYLAPGRGVMAVDIRTAPTFRSGTPKLLFRAPSTRAATRLANVSPDGTRFMFAVPPPPRSRQLTIVNRNGTVIGTIGKAGPYGQPSVSPDGTRVAVVRNDSETGNQDIWSFDVATGAGHAVTSDPAPDSAPVWSPDGKAIAIVSTRGDYTGLYKKAWDGAGREELLYRHTPGTPSVVLTDWSADGRFLSFYAGDILYALPLDGDRSAIAMERTEFSTVGGRFSPDGRFLAYLSDRSGRYEVYVRRFDPTTIATASTESSSWQVSKKGARGMVSWRQDGKEISYLAADGSLVAEDVASSPDFRSGTRRILFKPPSPESGGTYAAVGNPVQLKNVSRDGRRFVFAVQGPPNEAER